jgi:hypothetical protein
VLGGVGLVTSLVTSADWRTDPSPPKWRSAAVRVLATEVEVALHGEERMLQVRPRPSCALRSYGRWS